LTVLEANAVRPGTAHDYQRRLNGIVTWASENRFELNSTYTESVELGMLDYFDASAMNEKRGLDAGAKLLAAVGHFHPQLGIAGRGRLGMPRLSRALQG
jgi:hypothetical protein